MLYHIAINGQQSGPVSEEEVRGKIRSGELNANDMCWQEGWETWRRVGDAFPEANSPASASATPAQAAPPPMSATPVTTKPQTSGLAITSLVLGIFSILIFITSLPAVICGHIARSRIKRSEGRLTGGGMALAGIIIGYLTMVLFVVGLMAAMAIPAFQKVRSTSQEKAVLNNLRQISAAADQFMLETGVDVVRYDQIVGPESNKYIPQILPVVGEDYSHIVVSQSDPLIAVRLPDGRVIEYEP